MAVSTKPTVNIRRNTMSSAASAAQIAANKANALKSTGPRTTEGKASVASNAPEAHRADAVKLRRSSIVRDQNDGHGLRSKRNPLDLATDTALPFEREEFEATLAAFMADLQPTGPLETRLVERLAQIDLRLNRAIRIETAHLDLSARRVHLASANALPDEQPARNSWLTTLAFLHDPAALKLIGQYESRLGRDFARTLGQLRQAQSVKRTGRAPSCALNVTRTAPLVGLSQERAPLSAMEEKPRIQTQPLPAIPQDHAITGSTTIPTQSPVGDGRAAKTTVPLQTPPAGGIPVSSRPDKNFAKQTQSNPQPIPSSPLTTEQITVTTPASATL